MKYEKLCKELKDYYLNVSNARAKEFCDLCLEKLDRLYIIVLSFIVSVCFFLFNLYAKPKFLPFWHTYRR